MKNTILLLLTGFLPLLAVDADMQFMESSANFKDIAFAGDESNCVPPCETVVLPENDDILENYPNPFNPSTAIRFNLSVRSEVTLTIYSILGETVQTLHQGVLEAGSYTFHWNGAGQPSGVYICRLTTPQQVLTRRMVLEK